MGKRILGLDLGTNSIGWAVVDDLGNGQFDLVKRGVHIFQEGVKIEKGNESSKASERTGYRSARRLKFRRKLRKIETLKVLSEAGFCPSLTEDELKAWQSKKVYPENPAFRKWCKTSEPKTTESGEYKNPYYYRWLAATTKLDLDNESDRFKLGRAFYHIAQRRGFKSNRLDTTQESDGVVKKEISELSGKMDGRTLGQYFWEDCYQESSPIRRVHTSRDEHYLAEFEFICKKQDIPSTLKDELHRAVFFQRPLKSQKGLVANCPFEPKKKRAPVSHPLFEEFRVWQTLNNIKIQTLDDDRLRSLTMEEKWKVMPLFYRVSKAHFDFKDIAKKLTPRNQTHAYYKGRDSGEAHVKFNFRDSQSLAGCPFIAKLKNLLGEEYAQTLFDSYTCAKTRKNGDAKSVEDILHEVWHVLFSFDDVEKVKEYAKTRLGLDDEQAEKFAKINPPQGYGALSLKAIRKILPFLRQGLIYSHAVFFANLDQVIGISAADNERVKEDIVRLVDEHNQYITESRCINEFVREYKESPRTFEAKYELRRPQDLKLPEQLHGREESICKTISTQIGRNNGNGEYLPIRRLEERVGDYLKEQFNASSDAVKRLYHPSKEETYKAAERAEDNKFYLGDPRISSIRNPVFMRAMHRVKAVVNELLKQGVITDQTQVHLEMARELNDANKRAAIRRWQRNNETTRKTYKEAIEEDLKAQGIDRAATDDEILKYQLWEEQKHICPYTGKTIGLRDFIGENPVFDIEHTIPRSLSCDNSQENKTLCDREYNRTVKKKRIPFECPRHDEILQRIAHWEDRIDDLNKLIEKQKPKSRYATTKEAKDAAIQKRLLLEFERNYLREKCRRFTMEEVTGGFKNSQLVDTRIITKYARLYLKTVFATVHTVNGKTTDDFRRCWGVDKSRDNHAHHTVDAIVAACVTREQYDALASYYHDYESYELGDSATPQKPRFGKPWPTFTEDMKDLKNQMLVSYYAPNNLLKQTKKRVKVGGKRVLQQGKSARGSLHRDTFYGRISEHGDLRYVVRVPLVHNPGGGVFGFDSKAYDKKDELYDERQDWKTKDFERIVDPIVRDKVIKSVQQRMVSGLSFKDALLEPIWMNKEKGIAIKRVRCIAKPKGAFPLKKHRDVSKRDGARWKKEYYVENDENYMIALYNGKSAKGRALAGFRVLNNYTATNYAGEGGCPDSIDVRDVECELQQVIQIGDAVLVYAESPEELKVLTSAELSCRLYEAFGINGLDGRVQFRHHMEARDDKEQDKATASFSVDLPVSKIKVSPSNMKVLVEGVDFRLSVLGEVEFTEQQSC
ncbi:type II CRISPR RNA-guided endonuclease Cas9 [Pontiella agarivorans]|uniref:CRISPR-associated endonuclease Cas9 n=1 Tax=Pontiella agarivorans TaxID=3038953 RepID=A0ABU5N0G7_9BACT|nr:type II CRISPR RNA-guided endonuclease Cas9 [Pontiella agarivorans]MDZ8119913.1 HNH endonuclease domain-containing protein [Pontiella agarivorans]